MPHQVSSGYRLYLWQHQEISEGLKVGPQEMPWSDHINHTVLSYSLSQNQTSILKNKIFTIK